MKRLLVLCAVTLQMVSVADASDRIDRELANDAHLLKGVPLGVFRKYTDDPLAVLFHADPGDRMVRIIQYRRTR